MDRGVVLTYACVKSVMSGYRGEISEGGGKSGPRSISISARNRFISHAPGMGPQGPTCWADGAATVRVRYDARSGTLVAEGSEELGAVGKSESQIRTRGDLERALARYRFERRRKPYQPSITESLGS